MGDDVTGPERREHVVERRGALPDVNHHRHFRGARRIERRPQAAQRTAGRRPVVEPALDADESLAIAFDRVRTQRCVAVLGDGKLTGLPDQSDAADVEEVRRPSSGR